MPAKVRHARRDKISRATCDESRRRYQARPLRGYGSPRSRRHGRGLPGPGYAAIAGGRGQGPPRGARHRSVAPQALRSGGAVRVGPESPEHRDDLRHRLRGGNAVDRDGESRRPDAAATALERRDSGEAASAHRDPDRRGPGQGPRGRDRAPRPQARKRDDHEGRRRQDPRLRSGQADAHRGGGRRQLARRDRDADEPGDPARHGRLHVAGAGRRPARRLPIGSVRLRIDPLRDGDRKARVPEEEHDQHAGGHPERGTGADGSGQPPRADAPALDRRAVSGQGRRRPLRLDEGSRSRSGHGPRPLLRSFRRSADPSAPPADSPGAAGGSRGRPRRGRRSRSPVEASAAGIGDIPPAHVSARHDPPGPLRARRPHGSLQRHLRRRALAHLLGAAREPGVEPDPACRRPGWLRSRGPAISRSSWGR